MAQSTHIAQMARCDIPNIRERNTLGSQIPPTLWTLFCCTEETKTVCSKFAHKNTNRGTIFRAQFWDHFPCQNWARKVVQPSHVSYSLEITFSSKKWICQNIPLITKQLFVTLFRANSGHGKWSQNWAQKMVPWNQFPCSFRARKMLPNRARKMIPLCHVCVFKLAQVCTPNLAQAFARFCLFRHVKNGQSQHWSVQTNTASQKQHQQQHTQKTLPLILHAHSHLQFAIICSASQSTRWIPKQRTPQSEAQAHFKISIAKSARKWARFLESRNRFAMKRRDAP